MGVVSEIIPCFARRRVFGYTFMAYSILAIAVIGFLVWGHHMFVSGQSVYASIVFSILSFIVAVPSAIKVFNWTATLHKGYITFDAPMLYALGFIGLFTIGGLTGLILAALGARRTRSRHLFRRRALPLRHGRRHGHGLSAVACIIGGRRSRARCIPEAWARAAAVMMFCRIQFDIFSSVHTGLLRHAAALSFISGGFSNPQCIVFGGRLVVGARLPAAGRLLACIAALRDCGGQQSLESQRARMANHFASAEGQLCAAAGHPRSVCLP